MSLFISTQRLFRNARQKYESLFNILKIITSFYAKYLILILIPGSRRLVGIRYTLHSFMAAANSAVVLLELNVKKWMFRCRVDDLDDKANRTWMYEDITCTS